MPKLKTIDTLGSLKCKTVLVRADLNVPFHDGKVTDATRIEAVKPLVDRLLKAGAKVVLMSHRGRPKGKVVKALSLKPIAPVVEKVLNHNVTFAGDASEAAKTIAKSKARLFLLENLRFAPGEEKNDPAFAKKLAALGDAYVNDAFSTCHRKHASTDAVTRLLPSAAGPGLLADVEALEKVTESPARPLCAVIGGSKVSTKIGLLEKLAEKADHLIIGGAMANTFLAAQGKEVGKSKVEPAHRKTALAILERAEGAGCKVHLPREVSVLRVSNPHEKPIAVPVDAVEKTDVIYDIGPRAAERFGKALKKCKTVLWNGPMGWFEQEPFDRGTTDLAEIAADLTRDGKLVSIAGGGDTMAALAKASVKSQFSYVSSAGGAFLETVEGRELPGVKALVV